MTVRCRHDRGEIGPSSSAAAMVLLLVGISMFVGLRVSAPVDTDEAVILGVVMI